MSVHIFYGFAKRRCPERPRCMYCGKRRTWVAFTYFGAPVCGECWDGTWRKSEEGECDPPFDAITNESSGEWLVAVPPTNAERSSPDSGSDVQTKAEAHGTPSKSAPRASDRG